MQQLKLEIYETVSNKKCLRMKFFNDTNAQSQGIPVLGTRMTQTKCFLSLFH